MDWRRFCGASALPLRKSSSSCRGDTWRGGVRERKEFWTLQCEAFALPQLPKPTASVMRCSPAIRGADPRERRHRMPLPRLVIRRQGGLAWGDGDSKAARRTFLGAPALQVRLAAARAFRKQNLKPIACESLRWPSGISSRVTQTNAQALASWVHQIVQGRCYKAEQCFRKGCEGQQRDLWNVTQIVQSVSARAAFACAQGLYDCSTCRGTSRLAVRLGCTLATACGGWFNGQLPKC